MFPFVPGNSVLHVQFANREAIEPGDIVCYPGLRGQVIAHRVVRIERGSGTGRTFVIRGDASPAEERVEEHAIAYVVTRVERGIFAYDLDSPIGRVLAAIALRRGPLLWAATRAATAAVRMKARVCPRHAREPAQDPRVRVAELNSGAAPQPVAASSESPEALLLLLNHELRTPLNGILGFVEVLLGGLDGPLALDERENLSFVRDAGKQLLTLVTDVLDLVGAVATDREPQLELVDLAMLLENERAMLEERRGVRPVYVRVLVPDETPGLTVDRSELARVLRVLGELALQATASGEVVFEVAPGDPQDPDVSELCLLVRADGPLFPSLAPRVDRPSSPAERDTRLRRLRLELARRLIERGLGRLEVRTSETGTSALALLLPRDGRSWVRSQATRADIPVAVRYLAATGHDLRTPLNAILGFSDLVAMQPHDSWTESQQRSLAIVRERARDLATMVDDMIDWAKLEVKDLKLALRPVRPRDLIERAVALAIERSGERGLKVEVELDGSLGMLNVDAERLVQALVGLMDHAVRASPAPTVRLLARRVDGAARIEVIDPGLQIREKDQAYIFSAFRPSFAPTGQRVAGLHLGTAVARALIRAHGGDVWFESRPSQGTTFVASLPDVCLA